MFQTPILVIAYHRVESTHDLFTTLREVQPEKLYVAADGALSNDRTDYQHCLEARCVFIPDWKCEMKTLFKETHQGKSKMFVQAMQWFFEQEEEGIVLFDDTVPTTDFFHFCKQMLEIYREDRRIGHISGSYLLIAHILHASHERGVPLCLGHKVQIRKREQILSDECGHQ